jgi:hypothetical protein
VRNSLLQIHIAHTEISHTYRPSWMVEEEEEAGEHCGGGGACVGWWDSAFSFW